MTRAVRVILVASVACLAMLVGCTGGGSDSDASTTVPGLGSVGRTTWSRHTCEGFRSWISALDGQSAIASASIVRTDPVAAKGAVVRLFDQSAASTAAYLRGLRRGGAPAVGGGVQLEAAVEQTVSKVDHAIRMAAAEARKLPATDAARLQVALADLVNRYEQRITGASRDFARIDQLVTDSALRRSFRSACAS